MEYIASRAMSVFNKIYLVCNGNSQTAIYLSVVDIMQVFIDDPELLHIPSLCVDIIVHGGFPKYPTTQR